MSLIGLNTSLWVPAWPSLRCNTNEHRVSYHPSGFEERRLPVIATGRNHREKILLSLFFFTGIFCRVITNLPLPLSPDTTDRTDPKNDDYTTNRKDKGIDLKSEKAGTRCPVPGTGKDRFDSAQARRSTGLRLW
jgi:hypothetical protein